MNLTIKGGIINSIELTIRNKEINEKKNRTNLKPKEAEELAW